MKKLFGLLLVSVLMLPMLVKADMIFIRPLLNDNVIVDGEVKVSIPLEYLTDYNFTLSYDTTMLETSKEMITTTHETSFIPVDGGGTKEEKNLFDVTVENGKITIKASAKESFILYTRLPEPIVTIKFKALKAGKTVISFGGNIMESVEEEITINEKNCPVCPTKDKNDATGIADKEKCNNNDLFLYISLGANALLFILLIISLLTRKNKNKVVE